MLLRSLIVFLCLVSTSFAQEHNGVDLANCKTFNGVAPASAKTIDGVTVSVGGSPAEACTDYIDANTSATRDLWLSGPGRYNGLNYVGFVFDDGAETEHCEIQWYIGNTGGTPSVNDFYCEIWLLDGSSDLDTLVGRSDKVDGQSWVGSLVSFEFSTTATTDCTGTNKYAVVLKSIDSDDAATTAGEIDTTNYISIGGDNEADTMTGNEGWARWTDAGVYTLTDAEDDPMVVLRSMQ